jgi:hypothetical protein
MKTFEVGVREVFVTIVKVEAEDAHDARQKAQDFLMEEDVNESEYDYTLGWDEWPVWDFETGDLAD